MKIRTILSIVSVALAAILVSACGSSKKVVADTSGDRGRAMSIEPTIAYAQDAPNGVMRAASEYNDTEEGIAYRGASARARAELSQQIRTEIVSAIEQFREKYGVTAISEEAAQAVNDKTAKDSDYISAIAQEAVSGSKVVKSTAYRQANGTVTVYVCVEVDAETVAKNLKKSAKLDKLIAEQDKDKIDENLEKFKDEIYQRIGSK